MSKNLKALDATIDLLNVSLEKQTLIEKNRQLGELLKRTLHLLNSIDVALLGDNLVDDFRQEIKEIEKELEK